MAKVGDVLRDLIQYHSKRAATALIADLPARVRQTRRELRRLAKAMEDLAGKVTRLVQARERERPVRPVSEEAAEKARFSKRTLRSIRQRFDLRQGELAKLLRVSPVTIAAWEAGKSRPRKKNLAQIVALRSMKQAQVDQALGRKPAPASVKPAQIKKLRKGLALTQAELAKLVAVSTAAVTSWEGGNTSPGRESRRAMAELKRMSRREVGERLGRRKGPAARSKARAKPQLSARQVKSLRKRAGLSQRRMARKLGVSVNTISNWESGRSTPRQKSIKKLLSMKK